MTLSSVAAWSGFFHSSSIAFCAASLAFLFLVHRAGDDVDEHGRAERALRRVLVLREFGEIAGLLARGAVSRVNSSHTCRERPLLLAAGEAQQGIDARRGNSFR